VHTVQEDAERADADKRMGPTLYRVERTSALADESTPAPQGGNYAFVPCTDEPGVLWSAVDYGAEGQERFPGIGWRYPDAAGAIERAGWANEEPRTIDAGVTFRAYLLTWSVDVVRETATA
jgi:hypothetical protein